MWTGVNSSCNFQIICVEIGNLNCGARGLDNDPTYDGIYGVRRVQGGPRSNGPRASTWHSLASQKRVRQNMNVKDKANICWTNELQVCQCVAKVSRKFEANANIDKC